MYGTRLATLVPNSLLVTLIAAPALFATEPAIWSDIPESQITIQGERWIVPSHYRTVALDPLALAAVLQTAPLEGSADARTANVILALPLPDGKSGRFRIEESPIMAPELAARYPELRTFQGQGIDDPTATVRFDQTPVGFHAAIHSVKGRIYIDPYSRGDVTHHISYFTNDYSNSAAMEGFRCLVTGEHGAESPIVDTSVPNLANGETLRTYRTVVAATGEYTAFHSDDEPTVAEGMAAIVIAMNRVNEVYIRELAIRMTLATNNDLVVYTDAMNDPYDNRRGDLMLEQNQTKLDHVIGNDNYDIGHVFSTGGGGIAHLQSPCVDDIKARGVTGRESPVYDSFWIDFVAHELGHQWGGNHSFNGDAGFCAPNRHGDTAYEPGSGTTIQAYAGICGDQNIEYRSDDYFHSISYQEIVKFITMGAGNTCAVSTTTYNTPPTPDAGASYTIPINTPFELCGSATDPEGNTLTYNWEQFNLGDPGDPNEPVANAPIFRSFPPSLSPCRTFPQLSDLQNNTQTLGEILPSYTRTLDFRMTVRDNRAGGGGVDYDQTQVKVSEVGGPFAVIEPNTDDETWAYNEERIVRWDVANTHLTPIGCRKVDILLSEDSGETYTKLIPATNNDGWANVLVPPVRTKHARIKISCTDNVFFDISDYDFNIESANTPPRVTITSPQDGASFPQGTTIGFGGSAMDTQQDGEQEDMTSSLSWTYSTAGLNRTHPPMNLETNIGSGGCFFFSDTLPIGIHTIRASVSDGEFQGYDEITISITDDATTDAIDYSPYVPQRDDGELTMTASKPIVELGPLRYELSSGAQQPDAPRDKPEPRMVIRDDLPEEVVFQSTVGCAEDPSGVPLCTLLGRTYSINVCVKDATQEITNCAEVLVPEEERGEVCLTLHPPDSL